MADAKHKCDELNQMAKAVGVDVHFNGSMPIDSYTKGIEALLLAIPAYVDKVVERKIMELERA